MVNHQFKKILSLSVLALIASLSFSLKAHALSNGVVTKAVSDKTHTSATLNGSYTLDSVRSVRTDFIYGTTPLIRLADETHNTNTTPLKTHPAVDSADFSEPLTLSPGTYYYRAVVWYNDLESDVGGLMSFTISEPNSAVTLAASSITDTVATLNGRYTVGDPGSYQTFFKYGTSPTLADPVTVTSRVTEQVAAGILNQNNISGNFNQPISFAATTPGATYYFQAFIASNSLDAGTGGQILSFTASAKAAAPVLITPPAPPSPVLTTSGVVVCTENCGWNELILQIQKIISFLLFDLAIPLAAIVFTYAGFKFMTSGGNPGEITKAKGMFLNVLIGLAIALAAWLIINTILTTLLANPTSTQYNLLKNPT